MKERTDKNWQVILDGAKDERGGKKEAKMCVGGGKKAGSFLGVGGGVWGATNNV